MYGWILGNGCTSALGEDQQQSTMMVHTLYDAYMRRLEVMKVNERALGHITDTLYNRNAVHIEFTSLLEQRNITNNNYAHTIHFTNCRGSKVSCLRVGARRRPLRQLRATEVTWYNGVWNQTCSMQDADCCYTGAGLAKEQCDSSTVVSQVLRTFIDETNCEKNQRIPNLSSRSIFIQET